MARGRWKYDEATDEVIETEATAPTPKPDAAEEARKKREQAERDEHPGTYL